MVITPSENGAYDFESVGFGVMNFTNGSPQSAYFQQLGYTNQSLQAIFEPNMRGFGLPTFIWYQMVNLIYRSEQLTE